MAVFDVTVEDSSPLITYDPDGAWIENPADNPFLPIYSSQSLHATALNSATATISFNGTGIAFFGGQRSTYGAYMITVDGKMIADGIANSSTPTVGMLGSTSTLSDGPHRAIFMNTGGQPIDLDRITITSCIGSATSQASVVTYDDTDAIFAYRPNTSAWSLNANVAFLNNTLHYTQTAGASASISFFGEAVAVYGTMSPDHARLQIAMDGRSSLFTGGAGGFVTGLRAKVLLYFENNLGGGQHTLTMTAVPENGTGHFMDVDAVTVYAPTSPGSNNSNANQNSGISKTSMPKGSIIGAVIGSVAGLILIVVLVALLVRRQRATRPSKIDKRDIRPAITPDLPMQGEDAVEASFRPLPRPPVVPANSETWNASRHSIAPSYYTDPTYASDASPSTRTWSIQSLTPLRPVRPSRRPPPLGIAM